MSQYPYDPTGFFSRRRTTTSKPTAQNTVPLGAVGPTEGWVDVDGSPVPEPVWTHEVTIELPADTMPEPETPGKG